ncbi:MAG TPA: hypothetical protein PKG96_06410 [Bacilli bacterium]|nr:hypothetical protein [Bacilli bacterium]
MSKQREFEQEEDFDFEFEVSSPGKINHLKNKKGVESKSRIRQVKRFRETFEKQYR